MILSQLGGLTAGVVGYALDGLSMRHEAIAMNIANAGSQGHRPVEVSFEKYLDEFMQSGDPTQSLPGLSMQPAVSMVGAKNSVEMQTVALNQNVLQYEALITGLNKYMSMVSMAVDEGKR